MTCPTTTARLAVLMTCHNRKATTLECLTALFGCDRPRDLRVDVVLVDDGSIDGTADAVAHAFPEVTILKGDGSLFWNRGMYLAFAWALERGYKFYLWLNDDTLLANDALKRLFDTSAKVGHGDIVVGCTCDRESGARTYGGWTRKQWWRPLKFEPLPIADEPLACDAMNGNCVLIPASAAARVGNLDWHFDHAMGDFDYGLRARRLGIRIWTAPGFVGVCNRTSVSGSSCDANRSLWTRLRAIASHKGLPLRSWARFARRHAGPAWPLYWVWPYFRAALPPILRR